MSPYVIIESIVIKHEPGVEVCSEQYKGMNILHNVWCEYPHEA